MRADSPSTDLYTGPSAIASWIARLAPWLTGVAFFALYAATTAPSLLTLFDDSLEFQLVLPTFAIAHPTGYPLYTLLGGLWSRLIFPFGSWAWRANIFSALAAAVAVGFVFASAQRLVYGGSLPVGQASTEIHTSYQWLGAVGGLAAATTFGLGPVWWAQATVAEVYALHNLLLAAVLLVALTIPSVQGRSFVVRTTLLALLIGLGLAHHRTIVLALPGVAVYLLWSVPGWWRPRAAWLLWLAALIAPLLLYLYLPLRAAAGAVDLHGSYTNTWQGFWDHVLARGYSGFFTASSLSIERTPQQWLDLVLAQVGWAGILLALAGCIWLTDAHRRKGWVLVLLVLTTNLIFALLYRVGDQEVFLLPVFLCLALLAGGGIAAIVAALLGQLLAPQPAAAPSSVQSVWAGIATVALLFLLLWGPGRGPSVNRSRE